MTTRLQLHFLFLIRVSTFSFSTASYVAQGQTLHMRSRLWTYPVRISEKGRGHSDSVLTFFSKLAQGKLRSQANNNKLLFPPLNWAQFSGSLFRKHRASQTGRNRDPVSTVLWLDSLPPLGGTPFSGIFPSQHSPDLDFPQSPPHLLLHRIFTFGFQMSTAGIFLETF